MSKIETGSYYPLKLDALPPSWQVCYVGNFADKIQPGFASGKHNKEGAGIPHIRPFNIDRQGKLDLSEIKSVAPDSDVKRLRTGDVLFNNTNSPELIGKTAVIASAGDWGFSNHMTRIRFKDDIAPKFAAYQLHFLWMTGYYLHNCVKHVNQASISSKTLANAVPFIAPPLNQQKRIVAEIEKQFSRLDEAVTNLKRVKANLKRYKAAVLKAAVEGRLVETEASIARSEGRPYETGEQLLQRILETRRSRALKAGTQTGRKGKYKQPAESDITELPELPEGWVWVTVEQLGDVGTGATPLRSRRDYYEDGEIPWVTSGALNEEFVSAADEYITRLAVEETNAKVFPSHTLLVAMYGEGKTRGKVSELLIDAAINQACAAIVMQGLSERVRDFTKLFFLKNYDDIRRFSSGGVQPNLNLGHIKAIAIPFPPLVEQNRIVAEVDRRLSLIHEVEARVDANLMRTERLRQSILGKAFSGQITRMIRPAESAEIRAVSESA